MTDRTPSRRSSVESRRTLRRQSSRQSTSGSALDIFDDENAVDFIPVADGFRPDAAYDTTAQPSPPSLFSSTPQPPPRAASPPRVTEYLKKRLARQERSPEPANPSSLSVSRREPQASQRVSSASAVPSITQRPLSSISGISTPASEHPYNVSSGPSHPYGIYPQVGDLNRSVSTSTVRTQNRPYSGPSRPTHPYAMYPQIPAASAELIDPFSDPADIANVGFPGLGQEYARRLGPDGEEADDLIGPDGHTEQLPPYTRFPLDLHPKQRAEVDDSETPLLTSAAPIPSGPPGNAADHHPEMSQSESLIDNEEGSAAEDESNEGASGAEDLDRAARWKKKGKRRTCWGKVPVWAWILLVFVLCVLAAILGAVVGKSVAHMHGQPQKTSTTTAPSTAVANEGASPAPSTTLWQTVTTTLVDATPLAATPANLPTLPTGTFAIPIQPGGNASWSDSCLRTSEEKPGWACNKKSFLNLFVQAIDVSTNFITLFAEYPKDFPLLYGAQAPNMRGPAAVQLMNELGNFDAGPAFYFQQLYDKVIIVKGPDLQNAANLASKNQGPQRRSDIVDQIEEAAAAEFLRINSRRSALPRDSPWEEHKTRNEWPTGPVLTGDMPWYCFWNSTILEGFIYANYNSTPNPTESSYVQSIAGDLMMTGAPTTAIPSGHYSQPPGKRSHSRLDQAAYLKASASAAAASTAGKGPCIVYPKIVKIEERRSIGMPQPYCQQMVAQQDGTIVPKRDPVSGNIVSFNLREVNSIGQHNFQPNNASDAEQPHSQKRDLPGRPRLSFGRDANGLDASCQCSWTFD